MNIKIRRRSPEPDNAISIGSVRTLLDHLEKLDQSSEYAYFFRGHENFTYMPVPSIYRNPGWIKNEDILFKELVLRCPNDFPSQQPTFQALVRMQHYSLPTRLLDLTLNPLIALYFSCIEAKPVNESGEVIIYRVPKREIKYFDSDTVSVISNISRRPFDFNIPEVAYNVDDLNTDANIKLLIHEIRGEKPYFEPKIVRKHMESVVCVKPKMDNARIIRQDGAFFIFGISGTKEYPAAIPVDYLPLSDKPRIIIKSQDKKKIRLQLQSLGITHGTIYPEIEHVADYIKNVYFEPTAS